MKSFAYLIAVFFVIYSSYGFSSRGAGPPVRNRGTDISKSELIRLLDDKDDYKKIYAIYNIGHKKINAREKLLKLISDNNVWVRRAATFSLGINPDKSLVPLFEKMLTDKNYGLRRAAVIALGNIKGPKTSGLLVEALKDSDYAVRELAVIAMAFGGVKSHVPLLVEMLGDSSIRVRRTAARALGALGDKTALKPLRQLLADIKDKKVHPQDERAVMSKLKKKGTFPYGFIHFPVLIEKLGEDTGLDLRVNDEVLYGLYINSQGPDNLDSVKMKFYHTPAGEALKKITASAGSFYYVESGTVNIAAKSYIYFDTDLEFEAAFALYMLGDKSCEKTIKAYKNKSIYKARVKQLLK